MTAADVIHGDAFWSVEAAEALAWLKRLPDRCVSLVLFSPPYAKARKYGAVNFNLKGQAWVDWLRPIVIECCRVSSGLVLVNAAGQVEDHKYSPIVECLVADLTRIDGLVCGPSPYAWVRNGVPGSGSKWSGYHRRCWEPVYGFALPDRLPLAWHNQLAFGQPPRFGPGGEMSNRLADGSRVNDPWQKRGRGNNLGGRNADGTKKLGTKRNAHGVSDTSTRRRQGDNHREPVKFRMPAGHKDGDIAPNRSHDAPAIACPPNVIRTGNGGGQLGNRLAHVNEAPMNLTLAERFVCWFAPPGSIVLDCFLGSGTTIDAAIRHGRRGIGCDLRPGVGGCATAIQRLRCIQPTLFASVS